jgi:hypothetical protein
MLCCKIQQEIKVIFIITGRRANRRLGQWDFGEKDAKKSGDPASKRKQKESLDEHIGVTKPSPVLNPCGSPQTSRLNPLQIVAHQFLHKFRNDILTLTAAHGSSPSF